MLERSVPRDYIPGKVIGWVRCPACSRMGTTFSHDDPSSQRPGIRMMSMLVAFPSGVRGSSSDGGETGIWRHTESYRGAYSSPNARDFPELKSRMAL
jgi:hypothetical protein